MSVTVAAIIAGGAAIVGAAFGALATVRTARVKAEVEEKLERLRLQHEQVQAQYAFAHTELMKEVEIAAGISTAIQCVRDKMRELALRIDQNASFEKLQAQISELISAVDVLPDLYGQTHLLLPSDIRSHTHKAKMTALAGILSLEAARDGVITWDTLKHSLEDLQTKLLEQQQLIWVWADGARSTAELLTGSSPSKDVSG